MSRTSREIHGRLKAITKRQHNEMRWNAQLHGAKLKESGPNLSPAVQLSPDQERAMDGFKAIKIASPLQVENTSWSSSSC